MMFLIYAAKLHLRISILGTSETLQIETSISGINNVATLQAPPSPPVAAEIFGKLKAMEHHASPPSSLIWLWLGQASPS